MRAAKGLVGPVMVVVLAAFVRPAAAQDVTPAVDIFAGYSLLPADGRDFPRQTSHGVQGSFTVNLTRWFGVVADVGAQWNTARDLGPNFPGLVAKTNVRELLVGPRFTRRSSRVNGFVHGWIGIATGHADGTFKGFSDSGLTFGGGGGVDVSVRPRVAVRVQYDLLGSFADVVEGNSRLGVGVVFRR